MTTLRNVLRAALSEIVGLFVDDWVFALLVVAWVGLMAILRPRLPQSALAAVLLFGGLALLTLVFVARKARALRSSALPGR